MFYHIVMMQFSENADDAFFARVKDYCQRVRAECAGVQQYFIAPNRADRADGLTHAIVMVCDDEAAQDAYQISAAHQEMKAFMTPFITRIVVFDGKDGDL